MLLFFCSISFFSAFLIRTFSKMSIYLIFSCCCRCYFAVYFKLLFFWSRFPWEIKKKGDMCVCYETWLCILMRNMKRFWDAKDTARAKKRPYDGIFSVFTVFRIVFLSCNENIMNVCTLLMLGGNVIQDG